MAIHFVADLHFNGDNARHAHPHGFADSAEMARRICETWSARVSPADTVWILGNVGNPVHLAGLPGIKHLVRGALDPQPLNCLATGRYASVCDFRRLDTEYGEVALFSDPSAAPEMDGLVLHGRGSGQTWAREGFFCVAAEQTGWGPVSLDQIVRGSLDVRRAA